MLIMVASFINKNVLLPYDSRSAGFKVPELFIVSTRKHEPHAAVPHGAVTDPKKPRGSREERATTFQIYAWRTTHTMQIF
jgi:hypothetical protein